MVTVSGHAPLQWITKAEQALSSDKRIIELDITRLVPSEVMELEELVAQVNKTRVFYPLSETTVRHFGQRTISSLVLARYSNL